MWPGQSVCQLNSAFFLQRNKEVTFNTADWKFPNRIFICHKTWNHKIWCVIWKQFFFRLKQGTIWGSRSSYKQDKPWYVLRSGEITVPHRDFSSWSSHLISNRDRGVCHRFEYVIQKLWTQRTWEAAQHSKDYSLWTHISVFCWKQSQQQ